MKVNTTFKERIMIVHQCDLCKKIVERYTPYILPVNDCTVIGDFQFKKGIKHKKVDLCNDCLLTLADLLSPYFKD